MAIGFILLIANSLVFYAVLKKKRYSTVDYLVGAISIHGQFYYVLTSLVALTIHFLPKEPNNSTAFLEYFQDWIACYFGLSFTILLTMFYVDRYLATSRPLFYKMKVRNRFGRIAIGISVCAALLLASLLVIVQFYASSHHHDRARHSYLVCLNTFTMICFVGMLLCYVLICRSLLYFAGRQMYIFGNSEITAPASTTGTDTVQNKYFSDTLNNNNRSVEPPLTAANPTILLERSKSAVTTAAAGRFHQTQQQKQHRNQHIKSKSIKMKKLSLPAFSVNSTTTTTAPSSVSFNNSIRLSTVRSARFSCPDSMASEKGPPDLPLWLIAMLSKEMESRDIQNQTDTLSNVNKMLPMQSFPMRRRAAIYNPSKGRRERGYTIVNVVSNLISSSRRPEFDKELRLSQVRNLVKILTTTLLLYLLFWSPFIVSVIN